MMSSPTFGFLKKDKNESYYSKNNITYNYNEQLKKYKLESSPKLLDLFCGAGGCSVGYYNSGFEITGIDIKEQKNSEMNEHLRMKIK
jgi:cyclopropane fatty-acyl-phospholipid synthase-like methyltransferase